MSIAGVRSDRGDEYQVRIALHWLIRMLEDLSIKAIQAQSTGIPGEDTIVAVDDVVVLLDDGRTYYIQAKKNQPKYEHWTLKDAVLKEELIKARDQIESNDRGVVYFYSRSPFGELQALAEGCLAYPDYLSFVRDASKSLTDPLNEFAKVVERSPELAFHISQKLRFGEPFSYERWDQDNMRILDRIVARADLALPVLERYLASHQARLRDTRYLITRNDVIEELTKNRIVVTPKRDEAEILSVFTAATKIGRNWLRTIGTEKIPRSELNQLIENANQGSSSILLTDRPGSGKTCLLLDFVDHIEKSTSWGLLFIKGDQYTDVSKISDFPAHGLPDDLVGQCARLAQYRKVIVVIDSLDVLSLSCKHGALKVFLAVMDQLIGIQGVTLVVACRNFDLKYDPLLRVRKWQNTVTVQPLDFLSIVAPLLRKWNVDPAGISAELQSLLTLPQNLRLFEKILEKQPNFFPTTVFELYDSFVNEIIIQDQLLGQAVVDSLQKIAHRLIAQRTLTCPKAYLPFDESILQRLISQEVLVELNATTVGFSHQTLSDCLAVRDTIAAGRSLDDFISSFPAFPFIRPSVRSFFFYLRTSQPGLSRRQVRTVLSNNNVAYHLKRLIVESIAEVTPSADDLSLVRWIFQTYPELFKRLLWVANSDAWFHILTKYWIEDAKSSPAREDWLVQLISKLKTWMNRFPEQVIALWIEALSLHWTLIQSPVWEITISLDKFDHWKTKGIGDLLKILAVKSNSEHGFLGKSLSRWVQDSEDGDELLWFYITKGAASRDTDESNLRAGLRCSPDEFHCRAFLKERLSSSDQLMSLALNDLVQWSMRDITQLDGRGMSSGFLHETSWRYKHNNVDMHIVDNLTVLLEALESALKQRAKHNDNWWRTNEPRVRDTLASGIRYLLIEAYKENPEANTAGIEAQLKDGRLLRFGDIDHELGQLMNTAYSMISAEAQEHNQRMILDLYSDEEWDGEGPPEWIYHQIYDLLIWIPTIFRTKETQAFIEKWQEAFGTSFPSPQIYSSGGNVVAPLSVEEMTSLSDESILQLLRHYEDYTGWHEMVGGKLVGSRDSVASVLRTVSFLYPVRFLHIFDRMIVVNPRHYFVHAIIDGVGEHLRCRFGNLQRGDNLSPIAPLPDGRELAVILLNYLEQYPTLWTRDWTANHALQACCHILHDVDSADRIVILLYRFLKLEDPMLSSQDSDALFLSVNSTMGVAAENAILLCNELIENGLQLSELHVHLLNRFARHSAPSVRISLLRRLPYLIYKMPAFGWQIFNDIYSKPEVALWEHGENCLYYNYREHFDMVEPYLNKIKQESIEEVGDVWGRIATLSCLSGHYKLEQLFSTAAGKSVKAWTGIVEVLCANLDRQEHNRVCHDGLLTILKGGNLPEEVITKIEHGCFGRAQNNIYITKELAFTFLEVDIRTKERRDLFHFLDWLGNMSQRTPLVALELIEVLIAKINDRGGNTSQLWHTEPLVSALVQILREADESDDPQIIKRALALQDRLLQFDVHGMDNLFEQSIN